MKIRRVSMSVAAVALAAALIPTSFAGYDSPETREVIDKMVQSHGGAKKWAKAPSFNFTVAMYLASLPVGDERTYFDNWRYYEVTIDPDTSRGFVELPFEERRQPNIAFDGTNIWMVDYDFDPNFKDGPFQLLYYHYSLINLPWMSQVDGVDLKRKDPGMVPGFDKQYLVVNMSFNPQDKTHAGSYDLYIDPDTYLLRGVHHNAMFPILPGGVLPAEVDGMRSSMWRITEAYAEVGGMTIPRSYNTIRVSGDDTQLMGSHVVLDASFDQNFDMKKLDQPANARVVYTRP